MKVVKDFSKHWFAIKVLFYGAWVLTTVVMAGALYVTAPVYLDSYVRAEANVTTIKVANMDGPVITPLTLRQSRDAEQ